jgi:hypothetical protein
MIAGEFHWSGHAPMSRGYAGRNHMTRSCAAVVAAMVVVLGALLALASAAPPTVTPSPGYDARLQEQRAASAAAGPVIYQPAAPIHRRYVKRTNGGVH